MIITTFAFSPTGTSAKILKGVITGISAHSTVKPDFHDVTMSGVAPESFSADDLVIVAAPVYGGKIAPLLKQRLKGWQGNGAKCIVIAVYGNRAFENALTDVSEFMSGQGFTVCGGGAFIGEHSYSTSEYPIAQGRPDTIDMEAAERFGREVASKISGGMLAPVNLATLTDEPSPAESLKNFREFVIGYQKQQAESPRTYLPEVDLQLCDGCGVCYSVCPTEAITEESHSADPTKCIKCCACVKVCPQDARSLQSPFAPVLSANFNHRKSPRWIV
jgi:ferredoxin